MNILALYAHYIYIKQQLYIGCLTASHKLRGVKTQITKLNLPKVCGNCTLENASSAKVTKVAPRYKTQCITFVLCIMLHANTVLQYWIDSNFFIFHGIRDLERHDLFFPSSVKYFMLV